MNGGWEGGGQRPLLERQGYAAELTRAKAWSPSLYMVLGHGEVVPTSWEMTAFERALPLPDTTQQVPAGLV